jgi:hypothetical protein
MRRLLDGFTLADLVARTQVGHPGSVDLIVPG